MNPYGQVAGVTSEEQNTYAPTGAETGVTSATDNGSSTINNFTVSQFFGFFNIIVGLMLVASLLLFFGGFIAYLTRLGLENRMDGLKYMYYGISVLFVLIVLLAIVHYLQFNPTVVFVIVAIVIVIFGAWAAIQISQAGGEEEEH